MQRDGGESGRYIFSDIQYHVRICCKKTDVWCDVYEELSAPSVVSAEATWYGSLRVGVSSHDSDTKFADGGSRWGIKGSNEISEGLTAVYRFEHKIDTAKASLTGGGRLAYAGLKGGFGTITAGQIWSASYNSVGAITDNSFAYGDSETTYRHGSVISYANSFGPASVQLDLVMDGGRDTGSKEIDQVEFGLSVALGDIGKIAIAHVNKEDEMLGTMTYTAAVYMHTIIATANGVVTTTEYYSPKTWSDTEKKPWASTGSAPGTLITIEVEPATVVVGKNLATIEVKPATTFTANNSLTYTIKRDNQGNLDSGGSVVVFPEDPKKFYAGGSCNIHDSSADDACETITDSGVYVTSTRVPERPRDNVWSHELYFDEDVTKTKDMNPGSKTNHIAAEFSFGGVTPYLGYSEKKMNGKTKKDKTTFVGVRGSVGDTGFGYVFQYRDKENADGTKPEPWILGLSKTMGGGASLHFEHSDPGVKNMKGTTGVWLKVDF